MHRHTEAPVSSVGIDVPVSRSWLGAAPAIGREAWQEFVFISRAP